MYGFIVKNYIGYYNILIIDEDGVSFYDQDITNMHDAVIMLRDINATPIKHPKTQPWMFNSMPEEVYNELYKKNDDDFNEWLIVHQNKMENDPEYATKYNEKIKVFVNFITEQITLHEKDQWDDYFNFLEQGGIITP